MNSAKLTGADQGWTRRIIDNAHIRGTWAGLWPVAALGTAAGPAQAQGTAAPDYRARAITQADGPGRVSVSVISADERLATYGVPLAERRIQPVWIEIHNATDDMLWMLRSGTDPDCFSPLEVAW